MIDLNADTILDIRNDFDSSHPRELIDGCASQPSLPLVATAVGYENYASIWSTLYTDNWPPSDAGAGMTPYSGSLSGLLNFNNPTPLIVEFYGAVSRADFLFDTSGVDISQFQGLRIRLKAVAGTYAGVCTLGTPTTSYGVDAKPWVDAQNQWSPQAASSAANVATEFARLYGSTVVGLPDEFETGISSGSPPGSTGPRYLLVSVRGTTGTAAYCSQLKVYGIEATVLK